MSKQRGATWSKQETEELIAIWGDETVQAQLEGARHNHKIFERISCSLVEKGYESHDGKQCQEKIKKLKKKYREILDSNQRSGKGRKDWEFFDQMNEILGNRPMSRPSVLLESAQNTCTPSDSQTLGSLSQDDGTISEQDDDLSSYGERIDERLENTSISTVDDDGDMSIDQASTPAQRKRKADNSPCANTKSTRRPRKVRPKKPLKQQRKVSWLQ